MRVLVAGCAGFIGFHLTHRFLEAGDTVVGLDNLATGQEANVRDLAAMPGFAFVRHDITRPITVEGPFDLVCNLACPASPVDFGRRRIDILEVCSTGVRNLIDFCLERGARLMHTSTSEVYGDPLVHPQPEAYWGNVNPIGPRSCYDEGKRFAEALLMAFADQRGLRAGIARIFNTYGPRMRRDDGRVLPNFVSQALAGKPLTVHGEGAQTRSFCYVDDMAEGLHRLALSHARGPINLGNPNEITILEFARKIIEMCGGRSTIAHVPGAVDDPKIRRPEIVRAREQLGWTPQVPLEEGLRRTIDWFRRQA